MALSLDSLEQHKCFPYSPKFLQIIHSFLLLSQYFFLLLISVSCLNMQYCLFIHLLMNISVASHFFYYYESHELSYIDCQKVFQRVGTISLSPK